MTGLRVSAIMAVWNGERFVLEAIASMRGQTPPPDEIIVVDDGSTDGTARLVQACGGVRYIHQSNAGQAAALNRGIGLATGDLLAFNDADDVWTSRKLELQLGALAADPGLEAVFGHAEQFLEPDAPPAVMAALTEARRVIPSQLPTAMLIRRAAFDRVGPFEASRQIGAVVDWYHRAVSLGLRSRMLPEVVVRRRLHGNNIGWQRRDTAQADYLSVVRAALAWRRRVGGAPGPGGAGG